MLSCATCGSIIQDPAKPCPSCGVIQGSELATQFLQQLTNKQVEGGFHKTLRVSFQVIRTYPQIILYSVALTLFYFGSIYLVSTSQGNPSLNLPQFMHALYNLNLFILGSPENNLLSQTNAGRGLVGLGALVFLINSVVIANSVHTLATQGRIPFKRRFNENLRSLRYCITALAVMIIVAALLWYLTLSIFYAPAAYVLTRNTTFAPILVMLWFFVVEFVTIYLLFRYWTVIPAAISLKKGALAPLGLSWQATSGRLITAIPLILISGVPPTILALANFLGATATVGPSDPIRWITSQTGALYLAVSFLFLLSQILPASFLTAVVMRKEPKK